MIVIVCELSKPSPMIRERERANPSGIVSKASGIRRPTLNDEETAALACEGTFTFTRQIAALHRFCKA